MNDSMMLGVVKDNDDPLQTGRLKIYIPALDSKYYKTEDLPWALYVSPFGGVTENMQVGREKHTVPNLSSYGFWSVPKVGAFVLCGCLNGDAQIRFWVGCIYMNETNATLPQSVNDLKTELDPAEGNEAGKWPSVDIPHYLANLAEAGLGPDTAHYKTRGGYERSVAYPGRRMEDKPATDGYYTKPSGDGKDSQAHSWTTPGRHYIVMSDVDEHCRVRVKTTEGHQILLDDTNERIYVSTAKGRNWVEIDEDGRIHIYALDEINIRSEDDINITSEKNINIKAKKKINIKSREDEINIEAKKHIYIRSTSDEIHFDAKKSIDLKSGDSITIDAVKALNLTTSDKLLLTSQSSMQLNSSGPINIQTPTTLSSQASIHRLTSNLSFDLFAGTEFKLEAKIRIDLNSMGVARAGGAEKAAKGKTIPDLNPKMIEPAHEPWPRPTSKLDRNKLWKE